MRWRIRTVGILLLTTALCLGTALASSHWRTSLIEPAIAQSRDNRAIASDVYAQLPDFPLENHYQHTETGEIATDNTLVYRLLQYHERVERRPLASRFDWKLTLADYMGVNEWMDESSYPDRFLAVNPFHQDREMIQSLNRQQREALIQALLKSSTR